MKKILVTGASGTLGRPLVSELRERDHAVWTCDLKHEEGDFHTRCDVAEFRQLDRVVGQESFDYVYHLAAEFGRMNGEVFYEQGWRTNVIGTRNLLELQRLYRFRLIHASTSEVYGTMAASELREITAASMGELHNDYAISKWVNEQQIRNFMASYGTQTMILRFFNAYGPGEIYHPYRSVVCLFCYNALMGRPYTVYRGYSRVFMYIDDFIPTLANACERFLPGETINVGGSEYRSVEDLSEMILMYLGIDDSLVHYSDVDLHNVQSKRPDIRMARKALGHDPAVTLEEGVPKTIEWMKEVYAQDGLSSALFPRTGSR